MAYDLVPALTDVLGMKRPWQTRGCPPVHKCIADRGDENVLFSSLTPNYINVAHAFFGPLESLRNPRTDIPPLGLVVGKIESKIKASKVLVAINGHFVTGSPMLTFNGINKSFIAMLPVGALSRQNDIGIYLVDENGLLELTIQ